MFPPSMTYSLPIIEEAQFGTHLALFGSVFRRKNFGTVAGPVRAQVELMGDGLIRGGDAGTWIELSSVRGRIWVFKFSGKTR